MKYVALLRGINVGGNNKVAMPQLKKCFENIGLDNGKTYINSGNVIFETDKTSKIALAQHCEAAIEQSFGFRVICTIIAAPELAHAIANAPDWWDKDPAAKHNALFAIAPATTAQIMQEVGEAKPEYEQVVACEPIIFWSAPLKTFSRTRYSAIVGTKAYQSVTIRNANTTKKLAELMR